MDRRAELLDQGFEAVVTDDRIAHATSGKCWSDEDHLIALASLEEAKQHGYETCAVCTGEEADDDGDSDSA